MEKEEEIHNMYHWLIGISIIIGSWMYGGSWSDIFYNAFGAMLVVVTVAIFIISFSPE